MIIGIAGAAGSGKDTAADVLARELSFAKVSMADALREECRIALSTHECYAGAPDDIREIIRKGNIDVYIKPTPDPARRLLQWWGTNYRRARDSDYWVRRMESRLTRYRDPYMEAELNIVIPDIRFTNEVDMVRRRGGKVWFVQRSVSVLTNTFMEQHESEKLSRDYNNWDLIIDNFADRKEFEFKVLEAARELLN